MKKIIVQQIQKRLKEIEKEHKVKILYANESGSRAWGFESTDSDYDIRFIYKRSQKWYLKIKPGRDVIEFPIVNYFDYSGWDLKKTLLLLEKSNPVLMEWLISPIVYVKDKNFYEKFLNLSSHYFNPIFSLYHYLNMAKSNFKEFQNNNTVKIKKYFYVLRPVLACKWIDERKEVPPIEFLKLLKLIEEKQRLHESILNLLQRKKVSRELGKEMRITIIDDFLFETIEMIENKIRNYKSISKPKRKILDDFFLEMILDDTNK